MISFLLTTLLSAIGFFLGAYLLPGVRIKDFTGAVIVALVVALLNATLGWLLTILTLGLLSWGILSFVLTAIIIRVADFFLDDFKTDGFLWALLLALVVALVNSIGSSLLNIG